MSLVPPPAPDAYEILDQKDGYRGFFRFAVVQLRHALFQGGTSPILKREVLHQRRAVTVLPYDPRRDEVLLIEQFRAGAVWSCPSPWLIEAPAGMVEEGETVEAVARREVLEECGIRLGRLEHALDYLSSPGCTTERVSTFIGEALAPLEAGLHGAADEGEDIRSHVVPAETAFAWLSEGRLPAVTAVVTIQHLMLHRERLRRSWASGA